MAIGACGGSPTASHATTVKAQPAVQVPSPDGISVKVSGTTAVVTWGVPKGLAVPLKGYDFYLDQTPSVSLGPQVTSRKLTGLTSESHYVQVVAVTATDQSEPVATTFSVAYAQASPSAAPSSSPPVSEPVPPAEATSPAYNPPPAVTTPTQAQQVPTVQTMLATEACSIAVPDFTRVDSDSAAVLRGDDLEVATGHSFGSIIVELQNVTQNVTDPQLQSLISKGLADVVNIRNLFLAGGDPMQIPDNVDPDFQAVSTYCSSVSDPLGNPA